jgi:hypothetical protein
MMPGEQFDQDGYLSPIDILNEAEVADVRRSFDELEAQIGKEEAQIGLVGKEREYPFIWKQVRYRCTTGRWCMDRNLTARRGDAAA